MDNTLENWAKQALESSTAMPCHSLFFEVNPASNLTDTHTSAYIEEVSVEDEVTCTYQAYQLALAAQKERLDTLGVRLRMILDWSQRRSQASSITRPKLRIQTLHRASTTVLWGHLYQSLQENYWQYLPTYEGYL